MYLLLIRVPLFQLRRYKFLVLPKLDLFLNDHCLLLLKPILLLIKTPLFCDDLVLVHWTAYLEHTLNIYCLAVDVNSWCLSLNFSHLKDLILKFLIPLLLCLFFLELLILVVCDNMLYHLIPSFLMLVVIRLADFPFKLLIFVHLAQHDFVWFLKPLSYKL